MRRLDGRRSLFISIFRAFYDSNFVSFTRTSLPNVLVSNEINANLHGSHSSVLHKCF